MNPIERNLSKVLQRIRAAEQESGRSAGSVKLLAVSKTRGAAEIREAFRAGQRAFGENYLQEAMGKIADLSDLDLEWHFIGRIQSNKTRAIAEKFAWVHSLDSAKHLRRLSSQRPPHLPALNVCIQVNVSGEGSKGGLPPEDVRDLLVMSRELPGIRLRGLMAIPAPAASFSGQRLAFAKLRTLRDSLSSPDNSLDTLSMGMSGDLEAAIAEGATLVRIGTAIFGPRHRPQIHAY